VEKDIVNQLGKRVRDLRKKYNLTQEQLAGRSLISLKYIQRIEGKNPPSLGLEYLQKLSSGFGISMSELIRFK